MSDSPSVSSPSVGETPITELPWASSRVRKAFNALGITTIEQLVQHTAVDFLAIKNFGVTTLNYLREELAAAGYKLRGD